MHFTLIISCQQSGGQIQWLLKCFYRSFLNILEGKKGNRRKYPYSLNVSVLLMVDPGPVGSFKVTLTDLHGWHLTSTLIILLSAG